MQYFFFFKGSACETLISSLTTSESTSFFSYSTSSSIDNSGTDFTCEMLNDFNAGCQNGGNDLRYFDL